MAKVCLALSSWCCCTEQSAENYTGNTSGCFYTPIQATDLFHSEVAIWQMFHGKWFLYTLFCSSEHSVHDSSQEKPVAESLDLFLIDTICTAVHNYQWQTCHSRGPEQNSENIEPVMLLDIHTTGYMHWKHWKSSGLQKANGLFTSKWL